MRRRAGRCCLPPTRTACRSDALACGTLSRAAACELKRLYVREARRGRGVGRALAEAAVAAAKRAGYRQIYLDTLATMTEAQALYRSLGFAATDAYYETPHASTVYMRLDL